MAIFCSPILDNINKADCGMRRGGITAVFVANYGEIDTITSSTSNKSYDGITMKVNPVTSAPYYWYSLAFKTDTASIANEVQFGNNKYATQTITFTVEGISEESLRVLETAVDGEAVFIAKDYQGLYHLLGRVRGLMMSAMTYGTGAGADDIVGGEIAFSANEPELSNLVASGTVIDVWDGTTAVATTL